MSQLAFVPFRLSTRLLIWVISWSTTLPLQASRGNLYCSESHKARHHQITWKSLHKIRIKEHRLSFHKKYHISNNIANPFIKSNKDQNTSNNIHLIVFQAMHKYIYQLSFNPTRLCVLTTQIHSQFESQGVVKLPPRPCLYSRALRLQIQNNKSMKT